MAYSNYGNAAVSFASAYAQANAAREEGRWRETMSNINARMAEMKARDVYRRSNSEIVEYGKKIKQLVGTQRTSFAGQNVVIGEGSARAIQEQTYEMGAEDIETIRNNAWRTAFGFKQQAITDRLMGEAYSSAANFQANNTLITGSLSAIGDAIPAFSKTEAPTKPKGNTAVVFDPAKYEGRT